MDPESAVAREGVGRDRKTNSVFHFQTGYEVPQTLRGIRRLSVGFIESNDRKVTNDELGVKWNDGVMPHLRHHLTVYF
jgi:hypothetical protein